MKTFKGPQSPIWHSWEYNVALFAYLFQFYKNPMCYLLVHLNVIEQQIYLLSMYLILTVRLKSQKCNNYFNVH